MGSNPIMGSPLSLPPPTLPRIHREGHATSVAGAAAAGIVGVQVYWLFVSKRNGTFIRMSESLKGITNCVESATNVPHYSSTKSKNHTTRVQPKYSAGILGSLDSIGTWQRQALIESKDPKVPTEGHRFSQKQ